MDTTSLFDARVNRQREGEKIINGFDHLCKNEKSSAAARILGKKGILENKRKYNRYKPNSGAFALVRSKQPALERIYGKSLGEIALSVYKAAPSKMGQIVDMNPYGLSFHYIDNPDQSVATEELDILLAGKGFYLERMPFRIVSDTKVPDEVPYQPIAMRRLGVRFKAISVYQKDRLNYFLQNYTSGTA